MKGKLRWAKQPTEHNYAAARRYLRSWSALPKRIRSHERYAKPLSTTRLHQTLCARRTTRPTPPTIAPSGKRLLRALGCHRC